MAHLLNSSFLSSSSTLHRKPILPPSFRISSANRSRIQIQANIREELMPAMSSEMIDVRIVSNGDKRSKANSIVAVQSNTVEIDVEASYDGNSAPIMVEEGGVAAAGSINPLFAESGHEIDQAKSKANSSSSSLSTICLTASSAEPHSEKVTDNVGPSTAVKASPSWRHGKSFVHNSSINIAVALAMDGGLIISVLQDADKVDICSLSRKRSELVDKARAKDLQPHAYNSVTHYRIEDLEDDGRSWVSSLLFGPLLSMVSPQTAYASDTLKTNEIYEIGELFDLGIQLLYLILLLGLLGVGTYFVIRQVLVRRELDLSAKELQEQVRSGDASATELFELGAVMLRRKFYPAATKFLLQAIEKWDGDDQDLAQVYNALGVSYVRDGKLDKGIAQFEKAVKLQPGYVTAWNNLGDAYEKKKEYKSALKAFEEVLLFDPNNKVARPRRDAMKEQVQMYKGVPVKSKER
ncbi:hypothetical protein QN277_019511 [Acacia crassicarpa]|uniref:2-oxoacid dehydrogenase acyltransferase catalytic domain-containing protein n=1 Tax=Acacia crassicarpa TaxID=499986 RepID=A0AAE1JLZ8_9FABA|nr:hypothetical protein QN277_019511 [Acacia crassicarpa]